MPPSRIIVFLSLSAVLGAAVTFGILTATRSIPASTLLIPLADLLPREVSGWTVRDQPIAESEEMKKAIGEILNYDDAVFRIYTQGTTSVSIYIAYWKPGKMSHRLISAHSPDNCWINAGWERSYRAFSVAPPKPFHNLRKMEIGTYFTKTDTQNVIFWHVSNNKTIKYYGDRLAPWWSAATDIFKTGFNQRGEQYFIRISSNAPLSGLLNLQPATDTIKILLPICLNESPDTPPLENQHH